MIKLLPCPFCGSTNIDPEGWASTDRSGPACDDCAGTADTIDLWNKRPGVAAERERCALVAQHLNGWGNKPKPELADHIAKVIREG